MRVMNLLMMPNMPFFSATLLQGNILSVLELIFLNAKKDCELNSCMTQHLSGKCSLLTYYGLMRVMNLLMMPNMPIFSATLLQGNILSVQELIFLNAKKQFFFYFICLYVCQILVSAN